MAPTDSVLSRDPYVQLATQDSIHIVWRTDGPTYPVVRWGRKPDELVHQIMGDQILTRRPGKADDANPEPLHSAPEGTHQFEAKLTGLETDTLYFYAVYDSTRLLTFEEDAITYHFRTLPEAGKPHPLRFWVVGDSGTGKEPPRKVHRAMRDFVQRDKRPLDLYVHVGDMAYTHGKDDEFSRNFFRMYEETLRNTVVWPAMGNHEGHTSKGETGIGPYYDGYICPKDGEAGGVPSGYEGYYSFKFGRVHFIVLNSHDVDRKPNGTMARWLTEDLEKVTDADWLIAYWHHPPYTLGTHDSNKEHQLVEMREYIMPILESGGVDVVFTGHSHIYERSMLMDGAYDTPTVAENVIIDDGDGDPNGTGAYRKSEGLHPNEGTVQVVAGHGGQKVGRKGYMPVMRKIFVENGSVVCDIDGDTFKGMMVNEKGDVRDVFCIVKKGTVTPSRIENPWRHPKLIEEIARKKAERKAAEAKVTAAQPKGSKILIERHAEWHYLINGHPSSDWVQPTYNSSGWDRGKAGFGYEDDDDNTVLKDMRDNYTTVYIRNKFDLESPDQFTKVGLMMRWDDCFIAYINGKEVLRRSVDQGRGRTVKNIKNTEAKPEYEYFGLKWAKNILKVGRNVITIEGHNAKIDSSDFTLDPYIVLEK